MKETDVLLPLRSLEWTSDAKCILTGEPAEPRQLNLRRMLLVLIIWVGESASITMPLSKPVPSFHWELIRMLRLWAAFLVGMLLLKHAVPSDANGVVLWSVFLVGFIPAWCAYGWFLQKKQKIRLMGITRDKSNAHLRFQTKEAADRAKLYCENLKN